MSSDREISRAEYEAAIYQWIIGRNGERDRMILSMYLFDGLTYERMHDRLEAMGYPIGIDQIKKVIRRRKKTLFSHI